MGLKLGLGAIRDAVGKVPKVGKNLIGVVPGVGLEVIGRVPGIGRVSRLLQNKKVVKVQQPRSECGQQQQWVRYC